MKKKYIGQKSEMAVLSLPSPNPRLISFLENNAQYCFMVTGTKVGKTVGCSIWLVRQAINNPDTKWWWVAPVYKQAKIGFENMTGLLPRHWYQKKETDLSIHLNNGTVIECRSAENPDNLFGEAVNGAVIDEASRMRESAFNAIRTTVTATQGVLKIISNPKGRNWFYKYYCLGRDGLNKKYKSYSLSTYDSPYVRREDIEDARSVLPEAVFRELYLGEFLENSAGVFRGVERCLLEDGKFEDPLYGRGYIVGVDLAKYQDFTVLCVVDRKERRVVNWERFNKIDWGLQKFRISELAKRYNSAKVIMDSTGVGDPVFDDLRRAGINVEGYKFTNESKQYLIEALIVAIEQVKIKFPKIIEELIAELGNFEYNMTIAGRITYSAPEGFHDDCVIALALANWGLAQGVTLEFATTGRRYAGSGI